MGVPFQIRRLGVVPYEEALTRIDRVAHGVLLFEEPRVRPLLDQP